MKKKAGGGMSCNRKSNEMKCVMHTHTNVKRDIRGFGYKPNPLFPSPNLPQKVPEYLRNQFYNRNCRCKLLPFLIRL